MTFIKCLCYYSGFKACPKKTETTARAESFTNLVSNEPSEILKIKPN